MTIRSCRNIERPNDSGFVLMITDFLPYKLQPLVNIPCIKGRKINIIEKKMSVYVAKLDILATCERRTKFTWFTALMWC